VSTPPSRKEIAAALARAAEACRDVYRADPAYAGHTNIVERVLGVPGHPRPGEHDWWHVGQVVDEITGDEHEVWYQPRRLRVIKRDRPDPVPPHDPSQVPRIYRAQFGWIDRETGQYVPEPSEAPGGP
jgi:hypothetical protein